MTKEWTDLPEMNTPRLNHSLAVIQGKLVAIGGRSLGGGGYVTRQVEMLNLNTNTWKLVTNLPSYRDALSSYVVPFNKLSTEVRDMMEDIADNFMETDEESSSSTDDDSDEEVMMQVE